MTQLVLKRASASLSSGEWSDDDYDLLADGVKVGRIMKAAAKPAELAGERGVRAGAAKSFRSNCELPHIGVLKNM
jgi:hypothetical protein